ncbi:uncharacterized protein LOC127800534 [Diospyros lotus]|uniref:uncharacterized protein LOC127800534 n=1 Tax=Diospyros lotus TaxID=55363 RepID=UPI0022566D3A|nr:uncharacterized protein LOC127800534 [Diospyros lotus]
MANFLATVLLLLAFNISVKLVPKVEACYLDAINGGCPDKALCLETCRPCYRGIGSVIAHCVAPEGGSLFWRCRCDFKNGAPCPPVGPPPCPKPPALALSPGNFNLTNSVIP